MQTSSQDPAWYHAVTLTERLNSLRAARTAGDEFQVNEEVAGRRLERWRAQNPFNEDGTFAQRLAADGVSESEFLRLLGEPVEAVRGRMTEQPAWLVEISEAYLRAVPGANGDGADKTTSETERGQQFIGFLTLIEPLIAESSRRLQRGIGELVKSRDDLPFDPATIQSLFFANLPGVLTSLMTRTLVLEVNVARLRGQLTGSTPEERFKSFIERLRQRSVALDILREYPVLARQLVGHVNNWLNFSLEFLRHLCADWDAIRADFFRGEEPGVLARVEGGQGDAHRGGRSVLIAEFTSGFRVVYKPKSLAIDQHFQELLGWLNERGEHAPFRTIGVLDRGPYGWTEFVPHESCASEGELERFYERQGGYLALLYALAATDFHFENLIAAGEHPVLVDLESLFHPRGEGEESLGGVKPAGASAEYTVLRVGLLPQRIWVNEDNEGVDLSGLGGAAGQLTPHMVAYWNAAGTDEMRLERKRVAMPGGKNRPTLGGRDVSAPAYSEAIKRGFGQVYRLLVERREELLADDGPIARFARDEVRFIVRPTRAYSLLLQESFHPDLLRNALDRDRFFDRLWVGIEYRPFLARTIPAERRDLQNGDIPMFTTIPDSRHIWTSANEQLTDFLEQTGLELVRQRLRLLSEEDFERQQWFIAASLATLSSETDGAHWSTYELPEADGPADRERLLEAARAVGDRLEVLASREGGEVSWGGVTLVREKYWTLMPLGADLYNGLPGVMLFLAYLGAVTGERRYTDLAGATFKTLEEPYEQLKKHGRAVGGFDGLGGWIYALTHLGGLWQRPELLAEAEATAALLPGMIEEDQMLDVISGTAGCLLSLLALYRCAPSPVTLAAAVKCGEHLLARATPMRQGIGWLTPISTKQPLAGFSHGAAGMAYALAQLGAVSGDERFSQAATAALLYERSIFSPQMGNWPDLRSREGDKAEVGEERPEASFMLAWCHGAPGVGLSRLGLLGLLDDAAIRVELDIALNSTLADGFGRNHSLCHGDLGNLELLAEAGRRLDAPLWRGHVERLASSIVESIGRRGWICGIPLGAETPGLMTGLAGIGYGLLRLAEPERVPSVLMMAPPARRD